VLVNCATGEDGIDGKSRVGENRATALSMTMPGLIRAPLDGRRIMIGAAVGQVARATAVMDDMLEAHPARRPRPPARLILLESQGAGPS